VPQRPYLLGRLTPVTIAANDISQEADVLCPLCGYNLRGLPEARCPECGGKFEWPDLLDPTRKLHPYLFEHHPERNVWSFVRTFIGGLFPRRFWRIIHPAQPSRPKRLILYWILCVLVFLVVPSTRYVLSAIDIRHDMLQRRNAYLAYYKSPRAGVAPTHLSRATVASREELDLLVQDYQSVDRFIEMATPQPTLRVLFGRTSIPFLESIDNTALARGNRLMTFSVSLSLALLIWPWPAMLLLMLLRTTMRQASIRRTHLMRVCLYNADVILWLALVSTGPIVVAYLYHLYQSGGPMSLMYTYTYLNQFLIYAPFLIGMILTYRFAMAIRHYLRFRHAFGVAISVQIILALLLLQLLAVMYV
jgi:hypothetical protein